MELRAMREALRLLRLESGLSLDEIEGLNRATVHRIENVKSDPDYTPGITSVALIVEACGYTLGRFFTEFDRAQHAVADAADPGVLSELTDAETVKRVRAFLTLQGHMRELLSTPPLPKHGPTTPQRDAPTHARVAATHTKPPADPHRHSAKRKTGT